MLIFELITGIAIAAAATSMGLAGFNGGYVVILACIAAIWIIKFFVEIN